MRKHELFPTKPIPMLRVRWPDGNLSDMVNLSRANDAAARFNDSLDREYRGRERPSEAPYVRLKAGRAADVVM